MSDNPSRCVPPAESGAHTAAPDATVATTHGGTATGTLSGAQSLGSTTPGSHSQQGGGA